MTVGDRIKQRRLELGLTQMQLAERMGLTSKAAICKAEKRGDSITTGKASRYAEALDCDAGWLLGFDELSEKAARASELIKIFEFLSEKDQNTILALAKALASQSDK